MAISVMTEMILQKEECKSCATIEIIQLAATLIAAYPAAKEIIKVTKAVCNEFGSTQKNKRDARGGVI